MKTRNINGPSTDPWRTPDVTGQGAKKVIFTACHLGKLKVTFTSPNIISVSSENVLMSRLILSQVIFLFLLFLSMAMYANEVETREKIKIT